MFEKCEEISESEWVEEKRVSGGNYVIFCKLL